MDCQASLEFLWLALVALVGGCLSEPPDPGQRDDRVVILLESPPRDLDPRFSLDSSSTKVSRLVFCSLTTVETPDLQPALDAAAGIRPDCPDDPDCLTWIVSLRDDVFWHDGRPVTAEDVVYTYRSILAPESRSPFRGDLLRKLRSVEIRGRDVVFRLNFPVATFLVDLSIGLVPAHRLQPQGGLAARFRDDFVGCGPYRYLARYRDQKILLERFDGHHGDQGPQYLVIRVVTDEATRVLAMMSGSGDLTVNTLSPPVVRRVEELGELSVQHARAAGTTYLMFNLLVEPLADLRVRKALGLGLNRNEIVRQQFRGMGTPAVSLLPPFHWAFCPDVPDLPFDPDMAERLLDQAGYPRDPVSGIRLTLTLKTTTDRFRRNIGLVLAHQWNQIGVKVSLIPLELSTFLADVRKGNFEMYVLQLPELVEPDILRWALHSQAVPNPLPQPGKGRYGAPDRTLFPPRYQEVSGPFATECRQRWFPQVRRQALANWVRRLRGIPASPGTGNRSFYFDPTLDCLLDLGFTTMDRQRRLGYYHEAQRILMMQLPLVPLWHEDNTVVTGKRWTGYGLLPINRYSPVLSLVKEP